MTTAVAGATPTETPIPAAPSNSGTPASAPEKPAEPPRAYTQAEVDEITKKVRKNTEYRTKKEQEAYWRGRTEAQPKAPPAAPAPPPEDKEPRRDEKVFNKDTQQWDDKYPDYDSFVDARAAFIARRETRKEREDNDKAAAERTKAEQQAKRNQEFQAKAKAKYEDFEERISAIGDMPMLPDVYEAIADSSVGHDILIHFADSPSDYERIAALPMAAQIREIGKLEARFESAATPKPEPSSPAAPAPSAAAPSAPAAQVSRAPAPIAPLKGGSAPAVNVIKDGMDFKAFVAVRNRQLGRIK